MTRQTTQSTYIQPAVGLLDGVSSSTEAIAQPMA
jgi:hypothetical protein